MICFIKNPFNTSWMGSFYKLNFYHCTNKAQNTSPHPNPTPGLQHRVLWNSNCTTKYTTYGEYFKYSFSHFGLNSQHQLMRIHIYLGLWRGSCQHCPFNEYFLLSKLINYLHLRRLSHVGRVQCLGTALNPLVCLSWKKNSWANFQMCISLFSFV